MAYYYRINNEACGPVSAEELTVLYHRGVIRDDTLVAEQGAGSWSTYRRVMGEHAPRKAHSPAPPSAPMDVAATLDGIRKKLHPLRPILDTVQKCIFMLCYVLSFVFLILALLATLITTVSYIFSDGYAWDKYERLIHMVVAFVILMLSLILPVLLRIERNTRPKGE